MHKCLPESFLNYWMVHSQKWVACSDKTKTALLLVSICTTYLILSIQLRMVFRVYIAVIIGTRSQTSLCVHNQLGVGAGLELELYDHYYKTVLMRVLILLMVYALLQYCTMDTYRHWSTQTHMTSNIVIIIKPIPKCIAFNLVNVGNREEMSCSLQYNSF